MSTILSVESSDGNFNVTIKTDVGEIKWSFDDRQRCCEKFGVELSQPLEDLVGKRFINVDFDCYNLNAILTLRLEDGDWTANFYNRHNGYYAHNLDIIIDGKTKWNISL